MNLLAHLYLAETSHTSAAGQILGDMVKGRLEGRLDAYTEAGIRLHRSIDSFTDRHPITAELKQQFAPPLRRYAGILVDIGFDYCLARRWPQYSDQSLASSAQAMVARARAEWPTHAPMPARRLQGLDRVIAAYAQADGIQRALDSVASRLRHPNPLAQALPALLHHHAA
ncbi:MAG TPA: ACP phosphodiesterase, partial [Salinisphaeraceae bacterium]|nr:ACP phosphodiesterase [Salinisphaeraceae bacterium]